MPGIPLILADAARAEEFLLLGASRRLWDDFATHTDAEGTVWATTAQGDHGFAFTWLGPAWVFEPTAQDRRSQELKERREAMGSARPDRHRQELEAIIPKLRMGVTAERLLWFVHQQVLRFRSSLLCLPDLLLAEAIWTARCQRPTHWRQEILAVLKGLTWLHLTEGPIDSSTCWGPETVLLTHAADLRGTPPDACGANCTGFDDRRHHHYLINVGRSFLGILEQFSQSEDESGIRTYAFPVSGRKRSQSSSLRKVGNSGQLVSIYLPAKLGDRQVCQGFTLNQHRLLQAIVRETTRKSKRERQSVSEAQVMQGNVLPTTNGKASFPCALLDPQGVYVGFNGNKFLKGRGYLLLSSGGWLAKAGYTPDQICPFFNDLGVLTDNLALIPLGIEPNTNASWNLEQMTVLAASPCGLTRLRRLHLRIYAPADYLARWNAVFEWKQQAFEVEIATDPILLVAQAIKEKNLSQKELAQGMSVDPSLLNKVLRGKRPWPQGWLDKAMTWLNMQPRCEQQEPCLCKHLKQQETSTIDRQEDLFHVE